MGITGGVRFSLLSLEDMEGKMLMARGIEGIQFTGERRSEEEELERFYERRLVQVKIIN